MDKNKAQALLNKYLEGKCTAQEKNLVESWYNKAVDEQPDLDRPADFEQARIRILNNLPPNIRQQPKRLWLPYAAAAMLLVTIGTGLFFYLYQNKKTQSYYANDIKPGSNKAILTLANGKQIILSDAKAGELAEEGSTTINKTTDGKLLYDGSKASSATARSETAMNTITTPRGGQYAVTLADGSKVLLNAASSLKYPAVFTGNTRQVQLTGEAYFEVAHNKTKPFIVKTTNEQVQVLGTHFDVNAYPDEVAANTTLLEGSVKVSTGGSTALLVPGQQCVSAYGDNKLQVQVADIEAIMAWKNGDFVFKEESLVSIMRKVSRWYDVDVVYDNTTVQDVNFGGWVSRSKNISSVLKIMELTGKVHFKVEGRRITVM
ncbi:MAG: FecR domain-containing protein [Mucilaginibacter sp.]|uniref:FecR family protein n=1 Tax=Mucilaginibacter sp. TaxID=1882438 RepID=UPI0032670B56